MKTFTRIALAASLVALAGCVAVDDGFKPASVPFTATPPAHGSEAPRSPAASQNRKTVPAATLDAYKREVAEHIAEASGQTFEGILPPLLKSVVVLDITLDRDGRATRVAISRSNGFKDLERDAIASVKRVKTFPAPSAAVLNGSDGVRYMETWLFRDDGKFQIRSLVTKGQAGHEAVVRR